jgi:cell division inhibitor SepF
MASFQDMFGDIKSKLGLGGAQQNDYDEYDDYAEYDDYDEAYDEYDEEPAPEDEAEDDFSSGRFGSRGQVTTRTPRGTAASSANLVSYSEARRSMQSARADADAARARSNSFGRTLVDSTLPPAMTPEGTREFSAAAERRRSEGLDSLFASTDVPAGAGATAGASGARGSKALSSAAPSAANALESATNRLNQLGANGAQRRLAVLRPADYSQAEGVVRTLKEGDAVILVLTGTTEALTKRLLDFSFGAACALGAKVECVGAKTFAITIGKELSPSERAELAAKGIS